jgi:hypothetical protein
VSILTNDLSSYAVGTYAVLSGWTEPWNDSTWAILADATLPGGKYINKAASVWHDTLQWSSVPSSSNNEALCLLRIPTSGSVGGSVYLRVSGSGQGGATGVGFEFLPGSVGIGVLSGGNYTSYGSTAVAAVTAGTWCWMRARLATSGGVTTGQVKAWAMGSAEPSGWQHTSTTLPNLSAGGFGYNCFNTNRLHFGPCLISTAGESPAVIYAPTAPSTPTVSVTAVTETTATLTGGAFADVNLADTHAATEFRVRRTVDSVVVYGPASVAPGTVGPHTATGLSSGTSGLVGEIRYQDSTGLWSAWGTSSPFSTLTPTLAKRPVYRLTLYAKRTTGTDPENTPLVPRDSSIHANAFKVCSLEGITGFYPVMDVNLRGRRGTLDPKEKRVDQGELTVRMLDPRITAGGDNLVRWLTAFLGDTKGKEQLKGRKVFIEESLDAGTTWSAFYTGRVRSLKLAGRVAYEMTVRDMAKDMDTQVFVGRPDPAVTYASPAVLLPNGFLQAGYGNVTPTRPIKAKVTNTSRYSRLDPAGGPRTFGELSVRENSPSDPPRIATKVLNDGDGWSMYTADRDYSGGLRVFMRPQTGGAWGEYKPFPLISPLQLSNDKVLLTGKAFNSKLHILSQSGMFFDFTTSVEQVGLQALPVGSPNYAAMPVDGTAVEFYVTGDDKPTKTFPLFITDIHPVQLWKDLLDGKFGYLVGGAAYRKIAYDSAAFDALIADTSIPVQRFRITKTWKLVEFLEQCICKPNNLAYRLDALGRVVPLDLRLPTALPTLSIVDADLVLSEKPQWDTDSGSIVTRVEATYYAEEKKDPTKWSSRSKDQSNYPDENGGTVSEVDPAPLYIPADLRQEAELGGAQKYEVNAMGFRFFPEELAPLPGNTGNTLASVPPILRPGLRSRQEWIRSFLDRLASEVRGLFGNGASYLDVLCGRTANVLAVDVGTWVKVNVSVQPNPASNMRGGERVALCVERSEEGTTIRLKFLDGGESLVAVTPVLGAVALTTGATDNSVTVPLTLNASTEPVVVDAALVDSGAARPAEGSPLWVRVARVAASGNVAVWGLQSGKRVYLRAQSRPDEGAKRKLPSSFVFPTAPGYADLTSLTGPGGLAVSAVTQSTATIAWTPADASYATEVFLYQGSAPPADWEAHLVKTTPAGTTRYVFEGLLGPTTPYVVGLRHRLGSALSTMVTTTFSTNTTANVCPVPYGIALAAPLA